MPAAAAGEQTEKQHAAWTQHNAKMRNLILMISPSKRRNRWTNAIRVVIVLNFAWLSHAQTATQNGSARSQAENLKKDAKESPRQTRHDRNWRKEYGELYFARKKLQNKVHELEHAVAAGLYRERQPDKTHDLYTLKQIKNFKHTQQKLAQHLESFGVYLQAVLDIVDTSKSLKEVILKQYSALQRQVRTSLVTPSPVAERGGTDIERQGCRILKTDKMLNAVALNAGRTAGIKPGMRWYIPAPKGNPSLLLESIEVRRRTTAAIVVRGSITEIEPGQRAVLHSRGK